MGMQRMSLPVTYVIQKRACDLTLNLNEIEAYKSKFEFGNNCWKFKETYVKYVFSLFKGLKFKLTPTFRIQLQLTSLFQLQGSGTNTAHLAFLSHFTAFKHHPKFLHGYKQL